MNISNEVRADCFSRFGAGCFQVDSHRTNPINSYLPVSRTLPNQPETKYPSMGRAEFLWFKGQAHNYGLLNITLHFPHVHVWLVIARCLELHPNLSELLKLSV